MKAQSRNPESSGPSLHCRPLSLQQCGVTITSEVMAAV